MQLSDEGILRIATFVIDCMWDKKILNLLTVITIQWVSQIVVETTFDEEIRGAINFLKSNAAVVKKTFNVTEMVNICF